MVFVLKSKNGKDKWRCHENVSWFEFSAWLHVWMMIELRSCLEIFTKRICHMARTMAENQSRHTFLMIRQHVTEVVLKWGDFLCCLKMIFRRKAGAFNDIRVLKPLRKCNLVWIKLLFEWKMANCMFIWRSHWITSKTIIIAILFVEIIKNDLIIKIDHQIILTMIQLLLAVLWTSVFQFNWFCGGFCPYAKPSGSHFVHG